MKDKRIAMKPMIQSKAVFQQFFYLSLYKWLTPEEQALVVVYLFKLSLIADQMMLETADYNTPPNFFDLY